MTTHRFIRTYESRKDAEKAISEMTSKGWNVESFQVVHKQEGWSFFKTCCLGIIFLPLALLGRKADTSEYIVTFSRVDSCETS